LTAITSSGASIGRLHIYFVDPDRAHINRLCRFGAKRNRQEANSAVSMKRVPLRMGSRRAAQLAMLQAIDAIDAVAETPSYDLRALGIDRARVASLCIY
jgi:hypothetical protein